MDSDSWNRPDFWDDAYRSDPTQAMVADFLLEAEVGGLDPGICLDLGCGIGTNALMLAHRGWSVVGIDWAEHAIRLATESATELGVDATFEIGDSTRWRSTRQFDLVVSTFTMPGGPSNRLVLETAVLALAPGGTMVVAEWDASMAKVWPFDEEDLVTPKEITDSLRGLDVEKAEVRLVEKAFADGDARAHAGSWANVVLVRARRPPE